MEFLVEAGDLLHDDSMVVNLEEEEEEEEDDEQEISSSAKRKLIALTKASCPSKLRRTCLTECCSSSRASVITRYVVKKCPDGYVFSGHVNAVTGELVYGRRTYATGEVYEGPFQHEKRHGDGATCTWYNRSKFIGSYQNDQPSEGTFITAKFTYKGTFSPSPSGFRERSPLFHGENCSLVRENGDVYEGSFRMGLYHGFGREKTKRCEYNGEYSSGQRHGIGTLMVQIVLDRQIDASNGSNENRTNNEMGTWYYKYSGMWEQGKKEGSGSEMIFFSKPGEQIRFSSSFTGVFHRDERVDQGNLTLFDGTVLKAMWKRGRPVFVLGETNTEQPECGIFSTNGDIYQGDFCINPITLSDLHNVINERNDAVAVPEEENNQQNTDNKYAFLFSKWYKSVLPHGGGLMYYANRQKVYKGNFVMGIICQGEMMHHSRISGGMKFIVDAQQARQS